MAPNFDLSSWQSEKDEREEANLTVGREYRAINGKTVEILNQYEDGTLAGRVRGLHRGWYMADFKPNGECISMYSRMIDGGKPHIKVNNG